VEQRVLPVLQVLQHLPKDLAVAVLAAAPVDQEQQLFILPSSLHHLAVNAAFPSIRSHKLLSLDFDSLGTCPSTAHAVLHTLNTAASAPPKLQFNHIPMHNNDTLLQLISSSCMSASDLRLSFGSKESQFNLEWQPVMQLFQSLSCCKALSSLQLSLCDYPDPASDINSFLGTLLGLKELSLSFDLPPNRINFTGFIPRENFFMRLSNLTLLGLGPGFHFIDLPEAVPHMTRLLEIQL
jgi:hypothetical protein